MKISKPSAEELAPLLNQATQEGKIPEAEWRKGLIASFAKTLRKSPRQYRCFGPYWWIFKAALLEAGEVGFGFGMDAEWRDDLDYGSPSLNLLAAYAYYDSAFERGLIYSNVHTVMAAESDSAIEYTLVDEDMETQAIERGA